MTMPGGGTGGLRGRRILLVEDEPLVAMLLEEALIDVGAVPLGPAATVAEALALLEREPAPDAAVLDLSLGREMATPVADALVARAVPFIITTGHGAGGLPAGHETAAVLAKPYDPEVLMAALAQIVPG